MHLPVPATRPRPDPEPPALKGVTRSSLRCLPLVWRVRVLWSLVAWMLSVCPTSIPKRVSIRSPGVSSPA